MLLTDFDYELPEELIAQTPIEPRNASRLMVLEPRTKGIEHHHFYDLGNFLQEGDSGKTAAHGEEARLEKFPVKSKQ